jgi:hypothetical protein
MPSAIVPDGSSSGAQQTLESPRMTSRDARLRKELFGIIAIKIAVLAALWFAFVHSARVPVDADAMARHAAPRPGLSSQGAPNGH